MIAAIDPIKIGFIFLGAACTSLIFGGALCRFGWIGWRDGEYPLTETRKLSGCAATAVAGFVMLCGLFVVLAGFATLAFGWFRLQQLL